jgi:hypothetical protein
MRPGFARMQHPKKGFAQKLFSIGSQKGLKTHSKTFRGPLSTSATSL